MEEELERSKVVKENGIPEEHFLRKQRFQQFQSKVSTYKSQQEERKLEIVEKLLEEGKLKRQAKKRLAQERSEHAAKHAGRRNPPKKRTLTAPLVEHADSSIPEQGHGGADGKDEVLSSDSSSDAEMFTVCDYLLKDGTIMEPEIRGLWDEAPAAVSAGTGLTPQEGGSREGPHLPSKRKASKAELRIMKKAMEKLKSSKVQDQIAAGKKFKARLFIPTLYSIVCLSKLSPLAM